MIHALIRAGFALVVAAHLAACATPRADTSTIKTQSDAGAVVQTGEVRTFVFGDWDGLEIPVWSYRPAAARAVSPVAG